MKRVIIAALVLALSAGAALAAGYSGPKGVSSQGLNDAARHASEDRRQQDSRKAAGWKDIFRSIFEKHGVRNLERDRQERSRALSRSLNRPGAHPYSGRNHNKEGNHH